jgi:hypothetical protein
VKGVKFFCFPAFIALANGGTIRLWLADVLMFAIAHRYPDPCYEPDQFPARLPQPTSASSVVFVRFPSKPMSSKRSSFFRVFLLIYRNCVCISVLSHACYMLRTSHCPRIMIHFNSFQWAFVNLQAEQHKCVSYGHTKTYTTQGVTFIHSSLYFPFTHLQVQPKDVEIVIMCCTMCLLNYRCQMTECNYNKMITQ